MLKLALRHDARFLLASRRVAAGDPLEHLRQNPIGVTSSGRHPFLL